MLNVENLRKIYTYGTLVQLDHMEDDHAPKDGTQGIVEYVDDACQIHVHWENGSGLALLPEIDKFHLIEPKLLAYDIDYDYSREELEEFVDYDVEHDTKHLSDSVGLSEQTVTNKPKSELYDLVESLLHHRFISTADFFRLPNEIVIPWKYEKGHEDLITDFISDKTGFFINGYSLMNERGAEL